MSNYIILNWNSLEDIAIAVDRKGNTIIFDSEAKANIYAIRNFAWNWKVVEII